MMYGQFRGYRAKIYKCPGALSYEIAPYARNSFVNSIIVQ